MTDIVERLTDIIEMRLVKNDRGQPDYPRHVAVDAKAEIERLREENVEARSSGSSVGHGASWSDEVERIEDFDAKTAHDRGYAAAVAAGAGSDT
jgi:hypothetical protein